MMTCTCSHYLHLLLFPFSLSPSSFLSFISLPSLLFFIYLVFPREKANSRETWYMIPPLMPACNISSSFSSSSTSSPSSSSSSASSSFSSLSLSSSVLQYPTFSSLAVNALHGRLDVSRLVALRTLSGGLTAEDRNMKDRDRKVSVQQCSCSGREDRDWEVGDEQVVCVQQCGYRKGRDK
jgi:hypothetical protein